MTDQADSTSDPDDHRDDRGRFAIGNRAGKGNVVLRRQGELQTAIREAVTPAALREVFEKLLHLARGGDVQAARLLLEHAVGRPREKPATVDIVLPPLVDAAAVALAQRRVLEAAAAGELDLDAATRLTAGLQALATAHRDAALIDTPTEPDERFL